MSCAIATISSRATAARMRFECALPKLAKRIQELQQGDLSDLREASGLREIIE